MQTIIVVYRALFFRYITDIVHFLDTLRTINRRDIGALLQYLGSTINRFNDTSLRRYIAKTIYRRACRTSSRYIASVKYRSSDLSLNQKWFIAIYRSGDVSPQRVFSWREMLVFYISFKRNNYKFFQIPPPFFFGLCKLLMLLKCVCKGNIQWKRSQ